jgi:uncharacterized pyridoxamine 5'-phosphate oxidase family protein
MKRGSVPHKTTRGDVPVLDRLSALDQTERHAVLATASAGQPHASLVAFALARVQGGLLFATPRRTLKYRNLLKNPKIALLIDSRSNTDKDYLGAEAMTIIGKARPLRRGRLRDELADTLLAKHPHLGDFIRAPSTALILVEPEKILHVSRFQEVSTWSAR